MTEEFIEEIPVESHADWALRIKREAMVISRFQAIHALRQAGYLEAITQAMADPQTPTLAVDAWENALEFRRLSPTVQAFAGILGLTDAELDQLFELAATIEA